MRISTKGRYALRVMTDLAMHSQEDFVPLKEIALRQGVSVKYLEQIVAKLNKQGFVKTARGNTGGYQLAKEPKEYTIGEILRATEGDLAPIECLTEEEKCERKECCKTHNFWKGLDQVINEYIDSKTLEDLLEDS